MWPLAAEQAGGGVEPDPAGARDVDLGPGVQVGEVGAGPGRAVDRGGVGNELDQVARDEAGGEAEAAQHLHQQPRRVPARPARLGQGLVRRLHAGLHPHHVGDRIAHQGVERDEELHGVRLGRQPLHQGVDGGPGLLDLEVGGELVAQVLVVGERPGLGVVLDEEVERVDHRHVGGEVDLDPQPRRLLRKDQPGEPVAVGILLPVHEVVGRLDLQGVAQDPGAGMRSRTQPDHLRAERDGPVIGVRRHMMQGGLDRHGDSNCLAAVLRKDVLGGQGSTRGDPGRQHGFSRGGRPHSACPGSRTVPDRFRKTRAACGSSRNLTQG